MVQNLYKSVSARDATALRVRRHERSAHARAMSQLEHLIRRMRSNRIAQKHKSPLVAVAIPVCNEVERIARCIESLSDQRDAQGCLLARGLVRVVLLTNGCTDGTYEAVLEQMERSRAAITVIDVAIPNARRNAGCARRLANHAALDMLPSKGGLLFMTDADSCAPMQWISTYGALLRSGYDAVAGLVELDPHDCPDILPSLKQRGELEDRYSVLLDRIDVVVDPVAHDPWPRHYNAFGANLAIRTDALRGIGDFPEVACGEDRLLVSQLEAHGRKVRHDCHTRVRTSGRLFGRAAGGMADTLRLRLKAPDSACDPRLEFAERAYFRACLRADMRSRWNKRADSFSPSAMATWTERLDLPATAILTALAADTFHEAWQRLEASSPALERHPVSPCHLAGEIQRAEQLLAHLLSGELPSWTSSTEELSA